MMNTALVRELYGYPPADLKKFMSVEERRATFDLFGRYDITDLETRKRFFHAGCRRRWFETQYGDRLTKREIDQGAFWYE